MATPGRTGEPRSDKVAVVEEVRGRLAAADAAILTEYRGLTVKELADLRRSLRTAGGEYKIYKNSLVRFAVRDLGLDGLEEFLTGPTAIAFVAGDAVGVAKALRDYARTNPNLVVKGGVLGTSILSAGDASALADIPPREVLLARLAGLMAAPLQQFAGLLQALPRNFAYGLQALIDQRGGQPEPTATDQPEPTPDDQPEPTATDQPEPTPTDEVEPTATDQPEPTPTDEPEGAQ
jgi:large subunit ribosomal protein L10